MKVAITSTGPSVDSPLDERFGRAMYILIVNGDELEEVIDNSKNLNAAQGAGINAAQVMAARGIQWVITGHVGPKAYQALEKSGISISTGNAGSCREALVAFREGKHQKATGSDVTSHW